MYNFNGNNISTYITGVYSANLSTVSNYFGNTGLTTASNDLGINGISVAPSPLNYSINNNDISTYCIANYVGNASINKANIPVWCNHLRVVMVSSGGTGYMYNNQIQIHGNQIDHYHNAERNQDRDVPHSVQTTLQQYSSTPVAQQDQILANRDTGAYVTRDHYYQSHIHGSQTVNPGAGAFTYVDIQTANLQTLQITTNAININTFGIQLSNGGNALITGVSGSNGTVSLQGITAQGVNYASANLFQGKQYSSLTSGINGINVFDASATRINGNIEQPGFYRIYYLTS